MDLFIFDFDDTLAVTDSRVRVIRNGQDIWMTSREFAEFPINSATDKIDFSDFSRASGTLIKDTVNVLQKMMQQGNDVYIVTARSVADPVEEWLKTEVANVPPIIATSGSAGKKPWLLNHLQNNNYDRVVVYEDCRHNIRDLKDAVEEHNTATGSNIQYSAMCILPDQTIVKVENRWRSENMLNEWELRSTIKKFLRKTW